MARPLMTRGRAGDPDARVRRRPGVDLLAHSPAPRIGGPSTDEPVFDLPRLMELGFFPLRSLRRHLALAMTCFLGFVALAVVGILTLPKTYEVESKILTRRSMVLPALGNPRRTVPTESDAPARLAKDVVMSRENLTEVIKATGMLKMWPMSLPAIRRGIEVVRERIEGPRDEKERLDVLIKELQKRLYVIGGDDKEGTVTLGIGWTNPELTLSIVKTVQERFLAERYQQDVSLVSESVSILERYVARSGSNMTAALDTLRSLPGVKVTIPETEGFAKNASTAARTRAMSAELTRQQTALQNLRAVLAQLETTFATRQTETTAKLTELETRYGPNHPEVVGARIVAEQAAVESPALVAARREEQLLLNQITELGATAASQPDVNAELALQRQGFEKLLRQRSDTLEDPRITNARSQLKIATTNYEDLLDRLEAAKIELETARVAFKYRYAVTAPPELPKEPKSPNAILLLLGGLFCGVLAALFAASARDILDGRVLESWQIQRQIGLPLLGEIHSG